MIARTFVIPEPTPIYHITHLDNLPKILASRGLRCCGNLRQGNTSYRDIAHQNIQDRRAYTQVPIAPRGVLHDYVPFYFAPRSPMLYVISKGRVKGYTEGQEPVVYLVSTVQLAKEMNLKCVFTDGHATMSYTEFYDDLADLSQIDWRLMAETMWNDRNDDNDRRRRRQAEFLVQTFFPWPLIKEIRVINREMKGRVDSLFRDGDQKPIVSVSRNWYY